MHIFTIVDLTWTRRTKKKNYPILDRKLIFLELLHLGKRIIQTIIPPITIFNYLIDPKET